MAIDHEEQLLEAAQEASQRSRNATYALLIFCVLLGAVGANQIKSISWMQERLTLLRYASRLYACPEVPPRLLSVPAVSVSQDASVAPVMDAGPDGVLTRDDFSRYVDERVSDWTARCARYLPRNEDARTRSSLAAHYVIENDLRRQDVEKALELASESRAENMFLLPLPIVDLKVDGNVAGLFAAIGHLVLLIWLFVALKQEILLADRVCLRVRDGYALLRYRSFFMAATDDATPRFRGLLTVLVWFLVWLPLGLSCALFFIDMASVADDPVGHAYRPDILNFYLLGEGVAVVAGTTVAWRLFVLVLVLGRGFSRGHIDWERMKPEERVEWVLTQLCWVDPNDPDQCHGRTVTDMLWMKHGALQSDVATTLGVLSSARPLAKLDGICDYAGKMALRHCLPWIQPDQGPVVESDDANIDTARHRIIPPTSESARGQFVQWRKHLLSKHPNLVTDPTKPSGRSEWAPYWYWGLKTPFAQHSTWPSRRRVGAPRALRRGEMQALLLGLSIYGCTALPWRRIDVGTWFYNQLSWTVDLIKSYGPTFGLLVVAASVISAILPILFSRHFDGSDRRETSLMWRGELIAVSARSGRWSGLRRVVARSPDGEARSGVLLRGEMERDEVLGRGQIEVVGVRRWWGSIFTVARAALARHG